MSVDQALPTTAPYGKAVWTDYEDNWRNKDAAWLQTRSILRYATPATRDADLTSPEIGQFVYDNSLDILEFRSNTGVWKYYRPLPSFTTATQDDAAGVAISHQNAGGKGIIFGPGTPAGTGLVSFNAPINVLGGVLTADATGLTIKTGAKTVKVTTDGTSLVFDSPITAPSFAGTFTASTLAVTGTLTAPNISMSGTLTGGVLNGTSGTIGGVGMAGSIITLPAGSGSPNAAGIQAGQGYLYGDASGAILRQRATVGSSAGMAYAQVTSTSVLLSGIVSSGNGSFTINSNCSFLFATAAGTYNGGPVIVQTADPGVANVPNGTIWCS